MNLLDLMVKIGVDDQASSRIASIGNSVKSGLGSAAAAGARAMAAATTAAVGGAVAIGKSALDSYASFEQLQGGVEKLFGGEAAKIVQENAQKAFQTAGMSANQYMEQATSFSASLLQSVGGDSVKAAQQADVAMRAMSDNVNTFGSNMQDVQNAFQGFAKGNYTMLDNLKLGYGGTQAEMKRLIADANEYAAANGKAADLSVESFSDIVTAIQLIQEKQHIAGTTAKEAATTIEGSIAMTKAAWQNLLAEFGKEDGDVGARVGELVDSAKTALLGHVDEATGEVQGGIIPRVQQIFQAIADAMPTAMPVVVEAMNAVIPALMEAIALVLPSVLEAILGIVTAVAEQLPQMLAMIMPTVIAMTPQMVDAAIALFMGIMTALTQAGPQIFQALHEALDEMVASLRENAPQMLEAAGEFFNMILQGIADHGGEIIATLVGLLGELVAYVVTHIPDMLAAAGRLVLAIVTALVNGIAPAMSAMEDVVSGALKTAIGFVGDMLKAGGELIGSIVDGIAKGAGDVAGGIGEAITNGIEGIVDFQVDIFNAGKDLIQGLIDGLVNNPTAVTDTLLGLAQGAVDGFLGFFGIASPSKLMKRYGGFINEGLAEGIEDTANQAETAMQRAADAVYGAASGEVDVTARLGAGGAQAAYGAAQPQVVININDPVIKEEADADRILDYVQTKIQRKAGMLSWNPYASMA